MAQFIKPTEGRLTSFYGRRKHPITGKMSGHHGVDIAKSGTVPIKATAAGTVSRARSDGMGGTYGNVVTIKHAGNWESLYAHMARYTVRAGQSVKQGQVIGYMGNTGGSTGQHLHFELHKGGWNNRYSNEVNPLLYYFDDYVKLTQEKLTFVGIPVKADGFFGPATEHGIRLFQSRTGLVIDGSAGPATIRKLDEVYARKQKENASTASKPTPPKKEEVKLYKPTSSDILNSTAVVLKRLEQKDPALSKQWREKLLNGTLTESDAIGLLYVAIDRGQIVGK